MRYFLKFFSYTFPKQHTLRIRDSERGNKTAYPRNREEVIILMEQSASRAIVVERQFDCYCTKVLKNEMRRFLMNEADQRIERFF